MRSKGWRKCVWKSKGHTGACSKRCREYGGVTVAGGARSAAQNFLEG